MGNVTGVSDTGTDSTDGNTIRRNHFSKKALGSVAVDNTKTLTELDKSGALLLGDPAGKLIAKPNDDGPDYRIEIAHDNGIKMPYRAFNAAVAAKIPYSVICAFLVMETAGGQNIYGHDGGKGYWFYGAGAVTPANYRVYKAGRASHGAQGVGPMQLTYPPIQDKADSLGGCWRPYINMLVGAQLIADLKKQYGTWHSAAYHYNGSGEAAELYANRCVALILKYYNLFKKS